MFGGQFIFLISCAVLLWSSVLSLGITLAAFNSEVGQCDNLIGVAHKADLTGTYALALRDREQITVAAFLNLFIAWEDFLEKAFGLFMTGHATISGAIPVKYVTPLDLSHASRMLVHINPFFDFSNHDRVRRAAALYFQSGYPFEGAISSINADLQDIKTIRNACAHFSVTTRKPLESLAAGIFGQPQPGITVYQLLISPDPRIAPRTSTIFETYKEKLCAAADLIARG